MIKIEQLLKSNPDLPVLFISNPDGDIFEFGTLEELLGEHDALEEEGVAVELTTAVDLLDRLDFEVYDNNEPTIRL